MSIEFDKRLRALAGCPVIEERDKGAMIFNPHPVICAGNDLLLAHEICHVLAGKDDYDIFDTAIEARTDNIIFAEIFQHVLNMLYDWYHEYEHGKHSGLLWNKLTELHTEQQGPLQVLPDALQEIEAIYVARDVSPESRHVKDVIDLVAWADRLTEELIRNAVGVEIVALIKMGAGSDIGSLTEELARNGMGAKITALIKNGGLLGAMGAGGDIGSTPKRSDYYLKTVGKYWHVIEELTLLWKRNKYDWLDHYYGEINWKNLCGLFLGEKLQLPVFRLFLKIAMSRSVYLVVDRSGSTKENKLYNIIMDTAIIIAESLRILGIPISILDVGVTSSVVNKIDEDLDLGWFTPMHNNGTPLGEVCSMISGADQNSYLLIITDGMPNEWEPLLSALHTFPGNNLTFVIGNSYGAYNRKIKNAIHVEPHTIIREMLHDSTLD